MIILLEFDTFSTHKGIFMNPIVIAVSRSPEHTFSKANEKSIKLTKGYGVEGDAHAGEKIKHRFLVGIDATRPNIRHVHLIQIELLEELESKGFSVKPGDLGENITTRGPDLLGLPSGTKLHIGAHVIVELTALRNPCIQIDWFQKGMLKEVIYKDADENLVRKVGVMGIMLEGGIVRPNDALTVKLPPKPHHPLEYVW
jgi:MOSC domain-containing protein YiiM